MKAESLDMFSSFDVVCWVKKKFGSILSAKVREKKSEKVFFDQEFKKKIM